MPGFRVPGPTCGETRPMRLGDGTSALTASPIPARSAERQHGVIDQLTRARSVWRACQRAQVLAPAQVLHETGCQLGALLDGLIPGLLQMLAAIGITTLAGAAAGGLIGAVFGGVGAAPGAVIGGQLGMDAGLALLTWLGVGFLLVAIGSGIGELLALVSSGARNAWDAPLRSDAERSAGVERAAHLFAQACGVLVRLILQGIVAVLLKNAALNASRGVVQTAGGVRSLGAEAAANEAVAHMVSQLRASRFGEGFAACVETNWRGLVENPKLKPRPKMMGPVPEQATAKAMTPSQMFLRAQEAVPLRPKASVPPAATATEHGPLNPGPLAPDVANTFRSGTYTQRNLASDETLYRVISDNGNPTGSYWTSVKPQGPLQSIIDSALDPNWGNTASRVVTAKVPAGTTVYEGAAAAQRGLVGGGNQIYIPKVDPTWIVP